MDKRDVETTVERVWQISQQQLIDSGIARRMFEDKTNIPQYKNAEEKYTFEECTFWVEEISYEGYEEKDIRVIIESPLIVNKQKRVQTAFGVEKGKSFGRADSDPLTEEQLGLLGVRMVKKQQELQEQLSIEDIEVGDWVQCLHNEWRGEVLSIITDPNRSAQVQVRITIGVDITERLSAFRKMTEEERKLYDR